MVKIDGEQVKSLREVKGLTQLYLASAVEVTTDTISRWENKRYPQIKKENAVKLAEALEVSLDAILDHHEDEVVPVEPEPVEEQAGKEATSQAKGRVGPSKLNVITGLGIVVAVLCLVFWSSFFPGDVEISAVRMTPVHFVAGQPFPVVVEIKTGIEASSFILREIIPPQCVLVNGKSPGAVVDEKSGEIKWLTKSKTSVVRVGYMLQTREGFAKREPITFSGSITQRKARGKGNIVGGRSQTSASKYHWADTDTNSMIDDEEILAVYDDYNEIDGLTLDMDQIEDIWFGNGYTWDAGKKEFIVIY